MVDYRFERWRKTVKIGHICGIMNLVNKIRGIIPPMTTPFTANGGFDEAALRQDVRYLIETAGVHGLAVTGSTGEGYAVTADESRLITASAIEEAAGRVPVITGIITNSTKEAIARGKAVGDLGVAALQVTPVHYLFRPNDEAMKEHFAAISAETGIPVIIYNVVPWSYLSTELLTEIISEVDGVIGVKQSAGDLKLMADLCISLRDKGKVIAATDALLYPAFALGAEASIAAILTAVPELLVQLWNCVQGGDHPGSLRLHENLLPIWNAIEGDNLPANVKYAMELQGRPAGKPRSPMPEPNATQRKAIEGALRKAGAIE